MATYRVVLMRHISSIVDVEASSEGEASMLAIKSVQSSRVAGQINAGDVQVLYVERELMSGEAALVLAERFKQLPNEGVRGGSSQQGDSDRQSRT